MRTLDLRYGLAVAGKKPRSDGIPGNFQELLFGPIEFGFKLAQSEACATGGAGE